MHYRTIAGLNRPISRIIAGTTAPAAMKGENCHELFDQIFGLGINTFDTARVYGEAETSLGNWICDRGNREDVIILSKCGHPDEQWNKRVSEKEMRRDYEESIQRLKTDYIDIYLLHRDDPDVPAGDVIEIFNALHAEGKIQIFGGSNWTHERIEEANEYAYKHSLLPFTVSSPYYGLAIQRTDIWGGGGVAITGTENQNARAWYRKSQMPVIAYSSMAHGLFSGRIRSSEPEKANAQLDEFAVRGYAAPDNFERLKRCETLAAEKGCTVAQIALAWLLSQEENTFAVSGTSSGRRMKENIKALEISLSSSEAAYLNLK